MEDNQKDIEILNDLIKINNDRVSGYKHALEATKNIDADLRTAFNTFIQDSEMYKTQLEKKVEEKGGTPSDSSTLPGKIYRIWMDTKTSIMGHNRKAILESCEYGEDAAQSAYKNALSENEKMDEDAKQLISSQQRSLQKSHNLIKQYRDAAQNTL